MHPGSSRPPRMLFAPRGYAPGAGYIPPARSWNGRHSRREWLLRDGQCPTRGVDRHRGRMPRGFPTRALFPKIRRAREVGTVSLRTPYLLFIGDAPDQLAAKTAAGIAFWRPEISRGQFRLPGCNADLGIPDMNIEEAAAAGVKTVIVG